MQIKPDEITSILKSRIEGLDTDAAELTEADQRKLVEEAVSELDFAALAGERSGGE